MTQKQQRANNSARKYGHGRARKIRVDGAQNYKRNSQWPPTERHRQTQRARRHRSPLTVSSHVQSPRKPEGGIIRFTRRTPKVELGAWGDTRECRKKTVGPQLYARYDRERRHRRRESREEPQYERGLPRERTQSMRANKRGIGAPITDGKAPRIKEGLPNDTRMTENPPPPQPKNQHREAHEFNLYQNEPPQKQERYGAQEKHPTTQIGVQISTSVLKMECALHAELDGAVLKDMALGRT